MYVAEALPEVAKNRETRLVLIEHNSVSISHSQMLTLARACSDQLGTGSRTREHRELPTDACYDVANMVRVPTDHQLG